MDGDSGPSVMSDDMPFLNIVFRPELFNLFGKDLQLLWTVGDLGASAKAGQVNG
jgi:hypothetical protein